MSEPSEPRVRRRVLVTGRVQGVWFRASCADEAQRLGVLGWIRNLPDGRVEGGFEGAPHAVEALVSWCGHGPPGATVLDIEVVAEPPAGESEFSVR